MKTISLFLFILVCAIATARTSQKKHKTVTILGAKYVRINDSIYAGMCEVTIDNYRTFSDAIKRDSSEDMYNRIKYDPLPWVDKFDSIGGSCLDKYYFHPAFNFYPIVNISWQSANDFCNWLTNYYNANNYSWNKRFLFTLPTEDQWELLADNDGTGYPSGFGKPIDETGHYKVNVNTFVTNNDSTAIDGGYFMVLVDSYQPNKLGFYQVIGNVAEMTSTKDLVKGGSWFTKFEDCAIDKHELISTPDPRVGFRVIMKVTKY
jgi:formylglycine-generating enzyme required for sulfatase activity